MSDDDQSTRKEFHEIVNMTAGELEKWLTSDESEDVGQKETRRRIHRPREWAAHRGRVLPASLMN